MPLDLGQSRRGVDMGPSAVRVAGLESKLEALGYDVKDGGNVSVAMLETRPEGDPRRQVPEGNHRDLHQGSRAGGEDAGERAHPRGSGRRPLHCGGDRVGRGRILPPQEPEDRPHLDRRAQRHQYAGQFSQRQRARHAAGRDHGTVGFAADQHLRLQPQGEARQLRAGGHSRRGQPTSAKTSSVPACMSSPCATSTSAACAR